MKKFVVTTIALLMLFTSFTVPVFSLTYDQSLAIQTLLDDACRISGVPGMSISIIQGDETFYFSSGYANREGKLPASENALYELASVSKAFTGLGILLLEEQGLLSIEDPIQEYLPWFNMKYKGKEIDMQKLTLNHFLHHTSGLTNQKHIQNIPQGDTQDMLQKTVEALISTDLSFAPGERYEYGTVNYDVLGLVIETVSGQSFESYMLEHVLKPLGLFNTYLYEKDASLTGQLAQGYRTSFMITTPYDAPDYSGNKPAGYIISSSKDMTRWIRIQMGEVQDIPEIFKEAINKSHIGNMSVPDFNGMYYASGWMVDAEKTIIEHSGGNPNFSTEVLIFPNEKTAICLLSNGANTNINLVIKIKNILDGKLKQSYEMSLLQLSDIVLSTATIVFFILSLIFCILGLRRSKINNKQVRTKKRILLIIIWLIITVIMSILCLVYPKLAGYDWPTLLVWQSFSIVTALISLVLLSASITYFVYARKHK
jgi:CubicO group peptidase (beta-lactamase class C family)